MTFTGLGASTLLGIAAVVGLLTLVLYVLKLRRRPVSVPFSPIWQRLLGDKRSTNLFSQLKRWLSLLLQLLLVGLLVLALGDPRLGQSWADGRHIVVLVDTSASMQARDVEPDRLGVAKQRLEELIQGLAGTDRMLVAGMGSTPHPLSTLTDDVAELQAATELLAATETRADFERALRFAQDSLRGASRPEIIVISDGALGDTERVARAVPLEGTRLTYVPVGSGDRNVAITQFSVRRYPLDKNRYEVMLELANTTDQPAEVELSLLGDGNVVDVSTLALGPQERLPRFFSDLGGANRTLETRLRLLGAQPDLLEADDRAYALLPERRRAAVLVVTPGNTYLEAALLLDEYLEVHVVAPDAPLPAGPFDVTILDGVAPERGAALKQEHGSLLYLNPPSAGAPVEHAKSKPITSFGFDVWDEKSPLLAFIAPENIQVSTGYALKPAPGDRVVGASELGPILVAGAREGQRFVALGFDPRNSDLVLRVAWPLFLLNTINTFAAEDVRYLSSYRTGEVWHLAVPDELDSVALVTPSGDRVTLPVKNGIASTFGERTGFYELLDADGAVVHAFAANLSQLEESRIAPQAELRLGEHQASAPEGFAPGARREPWIWLVFVVLAISALEWFSYHRRVTV